MQNQRGFVSATVLILIVLGLIVVGGGAYYITHQTPSQPASDNTQTLTTTNNQTQTTQQATTQTPPLNTVKSSATIDNPLVLTDGATLSGTVSSNISSLSILVGKGVVTPPKTDGGPNSMPAYALGGDSAAGGMTISSGRWTAWIVAPSGAVMLQPGTYTVALYDGNSDTLLTSAILTVKAGSNNPSVPGMSKYTDSDFGFSFWYPSSWQVTQHKYPTVQNDALTNDTIEIKDLSGTYPRTVSITKAYRKDGVLDASGACGSCGQVRYYFDATNHVWMQSRNDAGVRWIDTQADVSKNTMGGLHILPDGSRFGSSVIPLSARNFVLVEGDTGGIGRDFGLPLANTILALDPSVATPVSTAQQTQTVQAEATAYGI